MTTSSTSVSNADKNNSTNSSNGSLNPAKETVDENPKPNNNNENSKHNNNHKTRHTQTKRCYLVTGGSGFLGSHLVQYLLDNNNHVIVFDCKYPPNEILCRLQNNMDMEDNQNANANAKADAKADNHFNLSKFVLGDITKYSDIYHACFSTNQSLSSRSGNNNNINSHNDSNSNTIDAVFHLASFTDPWCTPHLYTKININGTKNIIKVCIECNITTLIYNSSTSVVIDGSDIQNGDESLNYVKKHLTAYSYSKQIAEEKLLAANNTPCKTCQTTTTIDSCSDSSSSSLISSPRAPQTQSQTQTQSTAERQRPRPRSRRRGRRRRRLSTIALRAHNVFGPGDTHFIGQVILKALKRSHSSQSSGGGSSGNVDASTGSSVSNSGGGGSISHMIGEGHNITDFTYIDNVIHAHVLACDKLLQNNNPLQIPAGHPYFITNCEPTLFWSFINHILLQLGCQQNLRPSSNKNYIAFNVAYAIAMLMEFIYWLFGWLIGWKPIVSRDMVVKMGSHAWFSCAKAKADLEYQPIVTLETGMKRTVQWFLDARGGGGSKQYHHRNNSNSSIRSRSTSSTNNSDTSSDKEL